ncbi:hypothetical protein [Caballeronia sp. LZ035]|nr:hypothetical protein [Caballeronia sp. LZ035]MDR5759787.1 hypothetical protein [Caballeronia sp. LZ035]
MIFGAGYLVLVDGVRFGRAHEQGKEFGLEAIAARGEKRVKR